MSNPGPASSTTPHYLYNGGSTDGVVIGDTAASLVGFYGATPVAQPANVAVIGNSATGTEIATAVNGIIAALIANGLMASA